MIARVSLDSVSSSVESGPTYQGMKYFALLEFNFSVLEYLKGSGADDIVAVWDAAPFFNTQQEAEDALPSIAAARNDKRDDREAIVFLQLSSATLASTQRADRYFFAWGGGWSHYGPDDGYSIASRHNQLWLPADGAASAQSQVSNDQQRFLMDVPSATGTAPTITLGDLKTQFAVVAAKLDAGDGSERYRECVLRTYDYERVNQYQISVGREGFFPRTPDQELASGLPSSSIILEKSAYGGLPNIRTEVWLEGEDADLFSVLYGDSVPHDSSGDGVIDSIQYVRRIVSARPLPEGSYTTNYNRRDARFVRCDGYSFSHDWTITVTAPEGTLHEAFFDPVTDGTAVAADDTNGVLKPAAFTDADGATATIVRIEWESGTVKIEVSRDDALAGHVLDFIELDGTTSLSLNADQATVDAANDTLSWSVGSQPWDDGDELMVRVRRSTPTPESAPVPTSVPTSVPTPTPLPVPSPGLSYLTEEIPTCTPVPGSHKDPCEPEVARATGHTSENLGLEPWTVRFYLGEGILVSHLVLRGTYLPGTVRCNGGGDSFRLSPDTGTGRWRTGWLNSVKCYADMRVNAYILGIGPPTLTVMVREFHHWPTEGQEFIEALRGSVERVLIEGGGHPRVTIPTSGITGREVVIFVGPSDDATVDVWQVFETWDVQRRMDGTVIAVHPHRDGWRDLVPTDYETYLSALEMELPAFTQAVTTANQTRVAEYGGRIGPDENFPALVTDANQLHQYYTEVGAYAPGAPVPAQPPPPCGLAVPNQADNPGLMRDCINLLAAKDTLRGTAALNWSVDTAISDWDGVSVSGSPGRVTELNLSSNDLTGTIPPVLGYLSNLQNLHLGDNQLTGCIPPALRGVDNNDLDSLGLPDCATP